MRKQFPFLCHLLFSELFPRIFFSQFMALKGFAVPYLSDEMIDRLADAFALTVFGKQAKIMNGQPPRKPALFGTKLCQIVTIYFSQYAKDKAVLCAVKNYVYKRPIKQHCAALLLPQPRRSL